MGKNAKKPNKPAELDLTEFDKALEKILNLPKEEVEKAIKENKEQKRDKKSR